MNDGKPCGESAEGNSQDPAFAIDHAYHVIHRLDPPYDALEYRRANEFPDNERAELINNIPATVASQSSEESESEEDEPSGIERFDVPSGEIDSPHISGELTMPKTGIPSSTFANPATSNHGSIEDRYPRVSESFNGDDGGQAFGYSRATSEITSTASDARVSDSGRGSLFALTEDENALRIALHQQRVQRSSSNIPPTLVTVEIKDPNKAGSKTTSVSRGMPFQQLYGMIFSEGLYMAPWGRANCSPSLEIWTIRTKRKLQMDDTVTEDVVVKCM